MTPYRGHKPHEATPTPKASSEPLEGTISFSSRGDGYISIPLREKDIYIPAEDTSTALPGDTVSVALVTARPQGRPNPRLKPRGDQGRVLKILKRARTEYVGTTIQGEGGILVVADNKKVIMPFSLEKTGTVSVGQKVLVELKDWNDKKELPKVTLKKIIGQKGDNNAEMTSIVIERGFQTEFPLEVEKEAEKLHHNAKEDMATEIKKRRDFRHITTFTIDPKTAKDFDDAISFQKVGDNYEIGVHIADVSHYVIPGNSLDKEAQKRGVSVYLVDRTIPMLPEVLSNDLCSLNPHEEKLAFAAVFMVTPKGEVTERWFGRTIIKSAHRFSYESAQEVLTDGKGPLHEELDTLNKLAKLLYKQRFEKGAISFEQDEVVFELDAKGKPLSIKRKQRTDTHKLVEEFMLLANREVATFVNSLKKHDKEEPPLFMYRIHDFPNEQKMTELSIFLKAIGYEIRMNKGKVTAQDINALFNQIEGEAQEGMIKTAAIRSMAKAIYSTKNIGHFGLGFDYYTHFTSPIRRYPDVLVHRLLQHYLDGGTISQKEFSHYERLASSATESEIRAAEAERESIKMKQVEYMQDKIGQTFTGIISGVTEWGMYLEDKETKCEGLVKVRDIGDDYYVLDQKNYCLVGERTKKKFSLGDTVKFKIVAADIERKTLDLALV